MKFPWQATKVVSQSRTRKAESTKLRDRVPKRISDGASKRITDLNMKNPNIKKLLASGDGKKGKWYLYSVEILPGVSVVGFGNEKLEVGSPAEVNIGTRKGEVNIEVRKGE